MSSSLRRPIASLRPPPPRVQRSPRATWHAALSSLLLSGVALGGLAGCGSGSSAADTTVREFSEAIRQDRPRQAYALLSEDYRQRVSYEEFERYLSDHPDEARDVAALLQRIDGEAEVTAVVRYADGQELTLVQEDGQWRIAGNPANLYDQSTPRAAVRSFVRAMERRRYDIVLRFVPNASRDGMDEERLRASFEGEGREEIERLVASLRANLDNPIEEVGDRATMTYGEGAAVQLILEDGVWKVEDPD
ncbi:MAG: hypothetical protein H6726_27760 [Sandaracinaceae bacterium]|nr:hypothetical protein [Myxococcales bacterium]MCB9661475.1 hypothetical protein [Sandaracinaceae bacterium]